MKVAQVQREIDAARSRGPLKDIVIEPCPKQLLELRAILRSMDPEPSEIVRVAGSDVAMAAAIIKVANSPLYARSRTASTVADAVALLGVAHSVSILTGFLVRRSFPAKSPLIEHFWESSLRRATAMGYIARQLFDIDPELAHTCGLFCHIALPVLIKGLRGYEATLTKSHGRDPANVYGCGKRGTPNRPRGGRCNCGQNLVATGRNCAGGAPAP